MGEFDPDKTMPGIPVASPEDAETREFHEDVLRMIERLNRETIDIWGTDGFLRTGLKVKTIDRVREKGSDVWHVTVFNPEYPDSALDTMRLTLSEFQERRMERVIEQ